MTQFSTGRTMPQQESDQSGSHNFPDHDTQPVISKHCSNHAAYSFTGQNPRSGSHVTTPLMETDCVINIPADERSLDKASVVNVHCSDKGQENETNMAYNLEMLGDVALLIPNNRTDSLNIKDTNTKKGDVTGIEGCSPKGYYVTVNTMDL